MKKAPQDLVKIMHPTHDGCDLFVGCDATGFYNIFTHRGTANSFERIEWKIEKFPYDFIKNLDDLLIEMRSHADGQFGNIFIEVRSTAKPERYILKMVEVYPEEERKVKIEIMLNGNELTQLRYAFVSYFCM